MLAGIENVDKMPTMRGRSSMAERQPSKLAVVGSSPIARFQRIAKHIRAITGVFQWYHAIHQ